MYTQNCFRIYLVVRTSKNNYINIYINQFGMIQTKTKTQKQVKH